MKLKILQMASYINVHRWSRELEMNLVRSGLFDVEMVDSLRGIEEVITNKKLRSHFSFFEIDGKLIMVDTWDHPNPLNHFIEEGAFDNGPLSQVNLILKIQCKDDGTRIQMQEKLGGGRKIYPWTMFRQGDRLRSKIYDSGYYFWEYNERLKYDFIFFGVPRRGRDKTLTQLEENKNVSSYDLGNEELGDKKITKQLYKTKFALVLSGGGWDKKNRREVLFSEKGMPLVLNYKPFYPFELFEADRDYIVLEDASTFDPQKYGKEELEYYSVRSKKVFKDLFSVNGSINVLLRLLEECSY